MKKNISINICGTIYAIDEDAYQLLENYLQSMKNYFRNEEGGDEIADDIEHRVAELLWEYKQKGMTAVNIETIKEIINKVGNPADIDGEASAHSETSGGSYDRSEHSENFFSSFGDETSVFGRVRKNVNSRRFYRNADNKMLGGICSGLADYCGVGDVIIWRLAVLIFSVIGFGFNTAFFPDFFFFTVIDLALEFLIPILYIVIWIVVPEAKTPEDKLRMQGMDVNPENLKEQIVSDSEGYKKEYTSTNGSNATGCLKGLLIAFLVILTMPLLIALVAVVIALFVVGVFAFGGISMVTSLFPQMAEIYEPVSCCTPMLWSGLIAALFVVGIPIYFIIRLFKTNRSSLPSYVIAMLVVGWFLAVGVVVGSAVMGAMRTDKYWTELREKNATRNGICLGSPYQWEAIDKLGWNLEKLENVNKWLSDDRTGYGNLPDKALKLGRQDSGVAMSFTLSRTEHFDEGDYVLESLTDVEGKGGIVKAVDGGKDVAFNDLTDEGQKLWTMDWTEGSKLPIFENPDSAGWVNFAKDGNEFWTYRVSKPFHHKSGDITITISADKAYMNKFNIRHVQLRKVELRK